MQLQCERGYSPTTKIASLLKHSWNNTNTVRLKKTENYHVNDTKEKCQEEQDEDEALHVSRTNQSLLINLHTHDQKISWSSHPFSAARQLPAFPRPPFSSHLTRQLSIKASLIFCPISQMCPPASTQTEDIYFGTVFKKIPYKLSTLPCITAGSVLLLFNKPNLAMQLRASHPTQHNSCNKHNSHNWLQLNETQKTQCDLTQLNKTHVTCQSISTSVNLNISPSAEVFLIMENVENVI